VQQKQFLQDLGLLIVKIHLPIQFVKNTWLKICFAMHLCLRVLFLEKKFFSQKLLPNLVEMTKQECVFAKK